MTTQQVIGNLIPAGRESKKVANNTYARRLPGGGIAVRLHNTDILTMDAAGIVTVNTGGWHTVTTKERLNRYLSGLSIWQARGIWYWGRHKTDTASHEAPAPVIFTDGDSIGPRGALRTLARASDESASRKLMRRVNAYARLCADALPLAAPGTGDCMYCHLTVYSPAEDAGKSFGDTTHNTEHLLSHMDEGYVVPSLVYHALQERHAGDGIMAGAFQQDAGVFLGIARRVVAGAVRRYLRLRLNLAA